MRAGVLLILVFWNCIVLAQASLLWTRTLEGHSFDLSHQIAEGKQGRIYTLGTNKKSEANGSSQTACELICLNEAGQEIWKKQFNGTGSTYGESVYCDINGHVIVAYSFCKRSKDPNENHFLKIKKFSPEGVQLLERDFAALAPVSVFRILSDKKDAMYLYGQFQSSLDFDPGPASEVKTTGIRETSAFLLKLDRSGSFEWVRTFPFYTNGGGKMLAINQHSEILIAAVSPVDQMLRVQKISEGGLTLWQNLLPEIPAEGRVLTAFSGEGKVIIVFNEEQEGFGIADRKVRLIRLSAQGDVEISKLIGHEELTVLGDISVLDESILLSSIGMKQKELVLFRFDLNGDEMGHNKTLVSGERPGGLFRTSTTTVFCSSSTITDYLSGAPLGRPGVSLHKFEIADD